MRILVCVALIALGIIHLLPLAGVLGLDRRQSLYAIWLSICCCAADRRKPRGKNQA
jgi:hypothetical protein